MAIKIIVDSASDISQVEAKEMGITVVPIEITFGEQMYFDGVNLLPEEFYDKLTTSKILPTTSQINPYRWEEIFEEATKNGDEVVAIILSSRLSGTYNSACEAAKNYSNVYVVDSLSATIGERMLCEYALELASNGKTAKEIQDELEAVKGKICIKAIVDTLEYLKKGGRISSTTAFIGGMLSIKPLIAVIGGEVKSVSKAMGMKKAFKNLTELIKNEGEIDFDLPHGLIWSGSDKSSMDKYKQEQAVIFEGATKEIPEHIIGSTIGVHVGPGAVGFAFFKK